MALPGESVREPEPETIKRAQQGDNEAFEDLVVLYVSDVYRLARHIVGHVQTAEDVTQDTFLNAYRGLRTFQGRSKFSTWLFRIAHNCAVESIRRSSRQRDIARRHEMREDEHGDPSLRAAVHAALDSLPDQLRRVFTLVEVFGFTYPETAAILGWPVGTVKSRMHRARVQLIEALGEQEDAGEM
jgi:RNA polymerase sigma-70 factor (ECF subfamily)